ncbi:12702_t:CDS:2, partial [Ambispora gerdemannii]
ANLAPQLEHDPSARDSNRKVHKPFIYLATMDCLRLAFFLSFMPVTAHSIINGICSADVSLNENGSGHDIVRFGRPLWGSRWQSDDTKSWMTGQTKFENIILLAKFKLLGGTNQWNQDAKTKRKATLVIIACIATLYISPISSVAPDL